ncbi:phage major capsid protein [Lysinibacillus sp. LZ02]|uniref:phage major capsid protein n=1 Tax=Lysinibacillus sp. LZ02 TaxID=3420668 RepID=UPI003D3606D1
MKNLDNPTNQIGMTEEEKKNQIAGLKAAFESGDASEVAQRIIENYTNNFATIQDLINTTAREAKRANEEQWDQAILTARGVRELTNEEKKFYNAAIEVESFDEVLGLMPPTIYERVFEDLATEHPLLSKVNFQTVGATTRWVVRKEGATTAFWGDVTAEIQEMVDNGFATIDMGMYKLSGFLVVAKAMFELGPKWLDRYVRALLSEVVSAEIEDVIVNGTGKQRPIGMLKDLDGAVVSGEYPDKTPIVLVDFTPKTIGEKILAPTTKNGTRRYTGVSLMVNPFDYASKFFAAGAKQKDDGTWTWNNFAVPGLEIIQCPAVPLNRMISGKPKDYFLGAGSNSTLEHTDVLRMIEDQRLYLVRQLINGRPLDNDSFTIFDITNTKFVADPIDTI